jgi:hypothetical protein
MGLIIKPTESKELLIQGSDISLTEAYGRIDFKAYEDGRTIQIRIGTFASKANFKENKGMLYTNVYLGPFQLEILETEKQTIDIAHTYSKNILEDQGFEVEYDFIFETE